QRGGGGRVGVRFGAWWGRRAGGGEEGGAGGWGAGGGCGAAAPACASAGGADPAAGLAARRRVVRVRGAALPAGVSLTPDEPLLPGPSPLDSVLCSSLSSIRAISRQAPGRRGPQRAVRSARELVARDIPAG